MCGISLIHSWKNSAFLKAIKPMNDKIRHRGPDDEGYAFFSLSGYDKPQIFRGDDTQSSSYKEHIQNASPQNCHLAFGHRRLSIIDLSEMGHQPMCDKTKRYWITYNGEIYNYLELKKELQDLGYIFYTRSDTEVVINSYIEWGEDCLQRFNGMFAFALFDKKENSLFAARDRFAIKPLYYWVSPAGFLAISSEIKQFTCLPGWDASLNHQAAYDFLNWAITDNQSQTCFAGVYQLQGGYCFSLKLETNYFKGVDPKSWYKLPQENFSGSLEDAGEIFHDLLKDSVKLRCRSDVALGSCLSGGLDSSSIVCLLNQILQEKGNKNPQMTFSACSKYKQFDESVYISEVVNNTNVSSRLTYPDLENLLFDLDDLIWHQDEPFGSTSIFAQWEVFKLSRKNNTKVMLDGQGADEQLGGYSGFFAARFLDLVRSLKFLTYVKEAKKCKKLYNIEAPFKLVLNQLLPNWIKQPARKILNKTTLNCPWIDVSGVEINNPHFIKTDLKSEFQRQAFIQITKTSLPMLLHYEDRNSMAHSIEARTPFLDWRLVEFVQSLPVDYKLGDGITKRVLRLGLKNVLPEKIQKRVSKLGFVTPEELWVKEINPDLFKEFLNQAVIDSKGVLNKNAIIHGNKIINGQIPFNFSLWRLIVFGKWMKRFAVSP